MNILFLTHFPINIDCPHGGVESVNTNLVQALTKIDGIHIDVVAFSYETKSPKVVEFEKFTVHYLPRTEKSELVHAVYTGKKYLANYIRNISFDLIHANDTYGIISADLDYKKVFTIHGFIYGDTLVSGTRFSRIRSLIWKYFEVGGWKRQDNIISISPYVRERVSLLTKNSHIYDIDNPVSAEFFDIEKSDDTGLKIFSAAAICKRKNPLALVKAVNKLLEEGLQVELRLAGPVTEDDYGAAMQTYIESKGISDNVKLLGNLDKTKVMRELSDASIFALVSLEENSPMGIEEAMAASVPVVTSNRCGMPYLVQHGECGYLVDPFDIDDIANHIRRILISNELREAMSTQCKRVALERFHPSVIVRRTLSLYEEILQ